MTVKEYYDILDLPENAGIDDIKKAYRLKAYQYHPDINHSPEAKDKFIYATEAYEFLISYISRPHADEQAYNKAMEDWRKYRQDRSRKRATSYAKTSYNNFRKSQLYRTTRVFEGTRTIYSFVISILILVYTIMGYKYRLDHPWNGEKPSLLSFILLITLGLVFLIFSFGYLRSWLKDSKKK
ncbi:MAG TPA: DnaJ domain-containing protein [Bacteroidales bacterium]|nr:DnaJ domain-containing protein [Bacteroidales bacterium]